MFAKFKLKKLLKKAKNLYDKRERGANVNIKNEVKVLKDLAKFHLKHQFNKKFPKAKIYANEYYRAAAALNDPEAQYILGKEQLETGRFWQSWHDGHYGEPVHETYKSQCFKEAFALLEAADENGYPLAKRLHGLAWINGWGVEANNDKGFKMIVDSIEEANQWDKATEIFKELGLNKPEFFSAMMQMRGHK